MDSRSGRESQVVNILFQQNWNRIFVFVIVGLDPTIQKISDNLIEGDLLLPFPNICSNFNFHRRLSDSLIKREWNPCELIIKKGAGFKHQLPFNFVFQILNLFSV